MNWLIFDFETLGQSTDSAPLINVSAIVVNTDEFTVTPYTFDSALAEVKTFKFDVADQVKSGYVIEKSTLQFWESVSPEARSQLKPSKEDLTYAQFCGIFIKYLDSFSKIDYWWSRSNTFDPILLWRIFNDEGRGKDLNERLKFWKVRDIRTYIDAKSDFQMRNDFVPIDKTEWDAKFKAHNSSHDIVADVLRLQKIAQLSE